MRENTWPPWTWSFLRTIPARRPTSAWTTPTGWTTFATRSAGGISRVPGSTEGYTISSLWRRSPVDDTGFPCAQENDSPQRLLTVRGEEPGTKFHLAFNPSPSYVSPHREAICIHLAAYRGLLDIPWPPAGRAFGARVHGRAGFLTEDRRQAGTPVSMVPTTPRPDRSTLVCRVSPVRTPGTADLRHRDVALTAMRTMLSANPKMGVLLVRCFDTTMSAGYATRSDSLSIRTMRSWRSSGRMFALSRMQCGR